MLHNRAGTRRPFRMTGTGIVGKKCIVVSESGWHVHILERMAVQRIIDEIPLTRGSSGRAGAPPMNTLPDYLAPGLRIISVGLNPSPNSVRCRYPYATPQNRFWRALNRSQLVTADYPPGVEAMKRLLEVEKIGFTDVVKRPSPGAGDLKAADFRRWAPVALAKLRELAPRVVWFQGKISYRNFMLYAEETRLAALEWGAQPRLSTGAAVFVTPNPSAANAVYSLADIIDWMDRLALFVAADAAGQRN